MTALPVFVEGDEPRPWWVVRGYDAWVHEWWRRFSPVPAKAAHRRRFGR